MERRARQCLVGLCAVLVAELGGLAAVRSGPAVTRGGPGPFRGTPPELVAAGTQLGIPAPVLERLQVQWELPPGLREPRPGFITAVYFEGHIYIRPGARPADTLAYEYLHDVWARLAPRQRARLVILLDEFFADHRRKLEPRLKALVNADVSNGATAAPARVDELHSIACSRTRDASLRPDLRAYCDYVLPGRRMTTKVY
jgi:hypothetical protein